MKKFLIGLLVVVVLLVIYGITTYNSLVSLNVSVDKGWANVETQYQRRFDLIPNLVDSVKGAMKQEQAVFGMIADARTKYSGAATVDQKVQAASELESAVGRLLVVMENYPTLKSSENVLALQDELAGTENRISVERTRFNESVGTYNVAIKKFPSVIFASMFGFGERHMFTAAEGAENAPKVQL